jgi:hypothetical protein
MLLFRSEEHLARWLDGGHPSGGMMNIHQQWMLAQRWFSGRHRPEWRRRTPGEAEAVFAEVGLTGEFWSFGGSPRSRGAR